MNYLVTIDCWDTILLNNPLWDSKIINTIWFSLNKIEPLLTKSTVQAAFLEEGDEFRKYLLEEQTPNVS